MVMIETSFLATGFASAVEGVAPSATPDPAKKPAFEGKL
jgi:hypothetical protein